ncbi:MAG: hypothetical protein QW767_04620 [Thermoprotei archaeon]
MSTEQEEYIIYAKNKSEVTEEEKERLMVVAQNSLAEVRENERGSIMLVFPDNFQAREFREKLKNYYPNWAMRRRRQPSGANTAQA